MFKLRRGSGSGMGKSKKELRESSSGNAKAVAADHAGTVGDHSRSPQRPSNKLRPLREELKQPKQQPAEASPSAPPKERLFPGRKFGSFAISPKSPSSLRGRMSLFKRASSVKSTKKKKKRESDAVDDWFDEKKEQNSTPTRKSPKPPTRGAYYTAPIDRSNRKVNSANVHGMSGLSFMPNLAADEQETYELDLPDVEVLETVPKKKGRSKKRGSRRRPPTSAPDLSPYQTSPTASSHSSRSQINTASARPTLSKSMRSQSARSPSPYSMTKDKMSQSMHTESPYIRPKQKVDLSQSMRSTSSTPAAAAKSTTSSSSSQGGGGLSRRQEKLHTEREMAEEFTIGQVVELHGLKNEEMNGRKGRVYGKKKHSDRYHIALFVEDTSVPPTNEEEEEDDYVAIRPRNMKLYTKKKEADIEEPAAKEETTVPETKIPKNIVPKKKKAKKQEAEKKSVAQSHQQQVQPVEEEDHSDERQQRPPTKPLSSRSINTTNTTKNSSTNHHKSDITVDDFQIGEWVRLQGLRTETMNGREGYVYGMSEDRVHVVIDQVGDIDTNLKNFMQDQDYVAIWPHNLVLLGTKQISSAKRKSGGIAASFSSSRKSGGIGGSFETLLSDSEWETDTDDEHDDDEEELADEEGRKSTGEAASRASQSDSDWETDTDDDNDDNDAIANSDDDDDDDEIADDTLLDSSDDDEATDMKSLDDDIDERVIKVDDIESLDGDIEASDDDDDEDDSDNDDDSDEESSIALEMISEKSQFSAPKTTPPGSYKKKNPSTTKDTDATSITIEEIEEEESGIDFEYASTSDDETYEVDLKDDDDIKDAKDTKENEKSQVLDWYHCSVMLSVNMSDDDEEEDSCAPPVNDTKDDFISNMLSDDEDDLHGDCNELVANKHAERPQSRKSHAAAAAEASSVHKNHFSLETAVDKVKEAIMHEEMLLDLKKRGLSHEILCVDDDDASVVTMSDESYMVDLMSQIQQRSSLRQEELLEMAFDLFSHLASSKDGQFDGQSEEVFLKIHQQVTAKHGPELKERDDAKDRKLKKYLSAVHHKKY
ncbi:unnamed protein product [Cylindrotheca closterium]|uniref:Uncharacterized protein n=1 Tax=Cylindrotheca closterium TaxID=2856 RepID=A0AAD2G4W4_9STRA|nr:unnamed protein product [Cylindrotheca closterium]